MRDHDIKAHMESAIATLQTIQNNYPIDDPDIDITLNQTLDFLRWERFKVINKIRMRSQVQNFPFRAAFRRRFQAQRSG